MNHSKSEMFLRRFTVVITIVREKISIWLVGLVVVDLILVQGPEVTFGTTKENSFKK